MRVDYLCAASAVLALTSAETTFRKMSKTSERGLYPGFPKIPDREIRPENEFSARSKASPKARRDITTTTTTTNARAPVAKRESPRRRRNSSSSSRSGWCATDSPSDRVLEGLSALRSADQADLDAYAYDPEVLTVPLYMHAAPRLLDGFADAAAADDFFALQLRALNDAYLPLSIQFSLEGTTTATAGTSTDTITSSTTGSPTTGSGSIRSRSRTKNAAVVAAHVHEDGEEEGDEDGDEAEEDEDEDEGSAHYLTAAMASRERYQRRTRGGGYDALNLWFYNATLPFLPLATTTSTTSSSSRSSEDDEQQPRRGACSLPEADVPRARWWADGCLVVAGDPAATVHEAGHWFGLLHLDHEEEENRSRSRSRFAEDENQNQQKQTRLIPGEEDMHNHMDDRHTTAAELKRGRGDEEEEEVEEENDARHGTFTDAQAARMRSAYRRFRAGRTA